MTAIWIWAALQAGVAAWDTGGTAADPLEPAALERKDGWKRASAGDEPAGDLVATNGRLLAAVRRRGAGVELYSLGSGRAVLRARLAVPGAGALERAALLESTRGAVALEASWKG